MRTTTLIAKVFMWLGWAWLCMTSVLFSLYLAGESDAVNSFARPISFFELGLMIGPFAIWMSWRFMLLPRVCNPWVQMVLYGVGAFFSQQIMLYGIFLVEDYQAIFYALSTVAMIAYIPHWIRPKTPNKALLATATSPQIESESTPPPPEL